MSLFVAYTHHYRTTMARRTQATLDATWRPSVVATTRTTTMMHQPMCPSPMSCLSVHEWAYGVWGFLGPREVWWLVRPVCRDWWVTVSEDVDWIRWYLQELYGSSSEDGWDRSRLYPWCREWVGSEDFIHNMVQRKMFRSYWEVPPVARYGALGPWSTDLPNVPPVLRSTTLNELRRCLAVKYIGGVRLKPIRFWKRLHFDAYLVRWEAWLMGVRQAWSEFVRVVASDPGLVQFFTEWVSPTMWNQLAFQWHRQWDRVRDPAPSLLVVSHPFPWTCFTHPTPGSQTVVSRLEWTPFLSEIDWQSVLWNLREVIQTPFCCVTGQFGHCPCTRSRPRHHPLNAMNVPTNFLDLPLALEADGHQREYCVWALRTKLYWLQALPYFRMGLSQWQLPPAPMAQDVETWVRLDDPSEAVREGRRWQREWSGLCRQMATLLVTVPEPLEPWGPLVSMSPPFTGTHFCPPVPSSFESSSSSTNSVLHRRARPPLSSLVSRHSAVTTTRHHHQHPPGRHPVHPPTSSTLGMPLLTHLWQPR